MAARTTEAARPRTASPEALPAGTGSADAEHRHRHAAQHAIHANTTHLHLRVGDAHAHLELPPVDKLAFYAGLAGAAAFGVIEWPIAVIAGVGHLLSDDRRNRMLRALGEALDAV
jgi:hypothetical protein